jgi:hypothetical protein
VFGFQPFTIGHYRQAVQLLTELAMQTDKGIVLARALIEHRGGSHHCARPQRRRAGERRSDYRANRRLYDALAEPLTDVHRRRLDDLLKRRDNGKTTWLAWLRQPGQTELAAHAGTHRTPQGAGARPASGIERLVHQNGCSRSPARAAR